jgi:hypothetical protein
MSEHPKLTRAKELARKNGAGMVIKESTKEAVTVFYCNGQACCEMIVPRDQWEDKSIRELWDEMQKRDQAKHNDEIPY